MSEGTQERLLASAERILIDRGVHALTVRHVGAGAALNPTLVTYHFKSIAGLLAELCRRNLDPMLAAWDAAPAPGDGLDAVLGWWLGPLTRPAAFTPRGRALIVLDEIAAHGQPDLAAELLGAMLDLSRRLHARLAPLLPHLGEHELRARLRFISGAALGPPPRLRAPAGAAAEPPLDALGYLLPFARAALLS